MSAENTAENTTAATTAPTTPADSPAAAAATAETHTFQAEVRQVLDIVVHSLYKDRDIFIRELVSNASDSLEKLRHTQLTEKSLNDPDLAPAITLTTDATAGTLTITDTGIGLTHDELVENIGTIAHSGTKAFLAALREKNTPAPDTENLIGQFGVGFFSAFMVADTVTIHTRSWRPGSPALRWQSTGDGAYTITPLAPADAAAQPRGARITLHLKPDYKDFATAPRVKDILQRYSAYIPHPIQLDGEPLNTIQPLWLKNKNEVTPEQYKEFYKFHCHAHADPLDWLHFSADAPLLINALLYIPDTSTEKAGFARMEAGVTLHCRKILIDPAPKTLLPDWLRFLRGAVDSADLPLNISRETLQDSALLGKLNRLLTKRLLKHLEDLARRDPARYETFWREFSHFLKEGIVADHANRDTLASLLRYESSFSVKNNPTAATASASDAAAAAQGRTDIPVCPPASLDAAQSGTGGSPVSPTPAPTPQSSNADAAQGRTDIPVCPAAAPETTQSATDGSTPAPAAASPLTTLDAYIDRMAPNQKAIYYLSGPDRPTLETGPYLEAFRARHLEVLYLYENADDYVFSHLGTYKDHPLTPADQADLDLGEAPADPATADQNSTLTAPLDPARATALCEWLKTELATDPAHRLEAVATGQRLVDSPAAALNADKFLSPTMRRLMKSMSPTPSPDAPTPFDAPAVKLEINPRHPLIHRLDALRDANPALARLIAAQILDTALLSAGLLDNPRTMSARLYQILESAAK